MIRNGDLTGSSLNLAKTFMIYDRTLYWQFNEEAISSEEKKDKLYWFKNDLYHFQIEDEEILWSPTARLNDHIMDAAEKLICKKLGADDDYQSVFNVQKRQGAPYSAVKNEHIQLLHMAMDTGYLLFFQQCKDRSVG